MKIKVETTDKATYFVKGYSILKAEIQFTSQKRYAKNYDDLEQFLSIEFLMDELRNNRVIRKVEQVN
jgi:hypothetical protein